MLLEISDLTVEFGTRDNPFRAVDGVSIDIAEGEVVGIVGESGSGKSVTSLAIMGLIGYPGRVSAQRLAFDGRELSALTARQRRKIAGGDIAMIFQEPLTSLNPCFTVGFQIMEALRLHQGGGRAARKARAADLLAQVGIPDPASRLGAFPHQLSGGMNQRVMIAMAIAGKPRLLIADEPTTALDVSIQAQILELLLSLQRDHGMALMLITHDLGVAAETARRIVVMYAGQVVETSLAADLFRAPRHPYTAALLDALPERAAGARRLPAIPGAVPGIDDRPDGCLLNPRCRFAADRCRQRRTVQMIFQDPFGSLNPRKKAGAILTEPLKINTSMSAPQRREAARAMMARVGLKPEHYGRYPHMFSGGQRQRIAVARALMLNPRLVVADEPVSALDVSIQAQVLNLLLDLQDAFGLAYVFISHDLSVVRFVADEILVMYLGRPVEQAPAEALFQHPAHPYTRALIAATPQVAAKDRAQRIVLTGEIPSPLDPPSGCAFRTRCPFATEVCAAERPAMRPFADRQIACHHAETI